MHTSCLVSEFVDALQEESVSFYISAIPNTVPRTYFDLINICQTQSFIYQQKQFSYTDSKVKMFYIPKSYMTSGLTKITLLFFIINIYTKMHAVLYVNFLASYRISLFLA